MAISNLDRRIARRYVSRIYRLLNSGEWAVRFMRIRDNVAVCQRHGIGIHSVGFVDENGGALCIDYRFDVLATLVHECLHVLHPSWPERAIKELEIALVARISPIQAKRLHQVAGAALE